MQAGQAREKRFRELFALHERSILGYALRRVSDPTEAAEIVSETLLVAWRRIDDVSDAADARPWLFGIARKVLANQRRGALRRRRLSERLARFATRVAIDLPAGGGSSGDDGVAAALGRLSEHDAELLRLTYWESLKPAELAVVFDVEPSTIRSQLTRARSRFRTHFESAQKELQL